MWYQKVRPRMRGRSLLYAIGFMLLMGIAALHFVNDSAFAQGIDTPANGIAPSGTLPGTLPPQLVAKVTFVHAAPFASPASATAVDICDGQNQVVDELTGLVYQQSEDLYLDPGSYDWHVALTGSNCTNVVLALPELNLANTSETLVVITGNGNDYPIEALVVTLKAGGSNMYFPIIFKEPAPEGEGEPTPLP